MEYRVLSDRFVVTKFDADLEFHTRIYTNSGNEQLVPDDYADSTNWGLRTGDVKLSRNHGTQMLMRIINGSGDKETLDLLEKDLIHYIEAIRHQSMISSSYVISILECLLAHGRARFVLKTIEDAFEWYAKNDEEEFYHNYENECYAFEDIYIKAGDVALFQVNDLETAIGFYRLADLDWFHLFDDAEEIDIPGSRREKLKKWHNFMVCCDYISKGQVVPDDLQHQFFNPEDKTKYETLFLASTKTSGADTVHLTNEFYAWAQNAIEILSAQDHIRLIVLMSLLLRKLVSTRVIRFLARQSNKADYYEQAYEATTMYADDGLKHVCKLIGESSKQKNQDDFWNCIAACDYVEKIQNELRVKSFGSEYAYYTSMETFAYMWPQREKENKAGRLSVMNISYMNDPNEGKMATRFIWGTDITNPSERQNVRVPYVFMKCFTSQIDYLPMWELYGDAAKGCCLVLDGRETFADANVPLFRVCYIQQNANGLTINSTCNHGFNYKSVKKCMMALKSIAKKMHGEEGKVYLGELIKPILYLFKDSSYHYEEEVRILYSFDKMSDEIRRTPGNKLYVQPKSPICLDEVILGPKFEDLANRIPYIQQQVDAMCQETGKKMPKITKSSIDFR